jgi:hypothetical protein
MVNGCDSARCPGPCSLIVRAIHGIGQTRFYPPLHEGRVVPEEDGVLMRQPMSPVHTLHDEGRMTAFPGKLIILPQAIAPQYTRVLPSRGGRLDARLHTGYRSR